MKKIISLISLCACTGIHAQQQVQDQELEEIVVRAHPLSDNGLSQSIDVLAGEELTEELQSSLGETLSRLPGIRSASFGGAVGRPVIHGLGGARVKTTEDRIDSLDVSVTSTDHAVTVEPYIANQITVLKGPSTLLYGAGAIGGVVDTQTGRIPVALPEDPLTGRVELRLTDNADAESGALRLDGGFDSGLAWHLDAFSKSADDYEIAGELESSALRAAEEAEGEEHEEEGESDVLEGSNYDVEGGAFGLSWIGDAGYVGASISTTDAEYGLVGGHGHEEEHEDEEHEGEEHEDEEREDEHDEEGEESGRIVLEQTRFDLEAQLNNPFQGVEKLNVRVGVNDYEHQEIEGNGEVGTFFDNDAWEARLEVTHSEIFGFKGTTGVQLNDRDFSAIGEEAFVAPVETTDTGFFWVGERDLGAVTLELGSRIDRVEHRPSDVQFSDVDFSTFSTSFGLIWPSSEQITWSALLDYSERAPSIEELFSNGPHLATQTFEIGDPSLEKESGLSATLGLSYESNVFDANVALYNNDFSDFIYQSNTGELEDELPVLVYRQSDATFTGVDLELGFHLAEIANGDLDLAFKFDTVSADLSLPGSPALPRIPSDRLGVGLAWKNADWRARVDVTKVSSQNDVADFELPTDSYDDISMRVSRRFMLGDSELDVFLSGRNLADDEQREHVSFVKDVAPATGRRVELGVRLKF